MSEPDSGASAPSNFIQNIVERDLAEGRHDGAVRTRPQLSDIDIPSGRAGQDDERLTIEKIKELRGP